MKVTVRNTGELGSDTFDITTTSPWPVSLFAADGITPLQDTDTDGVVDTASVAQATSVDVIAKVLAPSPGNVGDYAMTTFTASSSLNSAKNRSVILQTAFPSPFVQVFDDYGNGAVSLDLVQTRSQQVKKITQDDLYGYEPAVVEAPNGNILSAWYIYETSKTGFDIESIQYSLVNRFGETIHPPSRLTENRWVSLDTYDYYPVVAATPDGRFGVLWLQELYKNENSQDLHLYNIFFAILDASGKLVYGPQTLTSNNTWYSNSSGERTIYSNPTIAATGDNHFVLAWQKYSYNPSCPSGDCHLDDVYLAVRSSTGSVITEITNFTQDAFGDYDGYHFPNLAQLNNNRVILTWQRSSDDDIYCAVLSSSAGVIKDKVNISNSSDYERNPDTVQLSDGNTVVVWSAWTDAYRSRFIILDSSYNLSVGPVTLANPAATDGENFISLATDQAGRAILTTIDASSLQLFYTLLNSAGSVVTPPMIFYQASTVDQRIDINQYGFASTSYKSSFDSGADGALLMKNQLIGGAPGGTTGVGVHFINHGQATAQAPALILTLPAELTYLGDNSGITPYFGAGTVNWNLPDLEFLAERRFRVTLQLPVSAAIGTSYPISFNLSINGEVNPTDNLYEAEVMVSHQLFMPWMVKP